MSMKLNRESYEKLIRENIKWLDQHPRCLERLHIEEVLEASIEHEYPSAHTVPLSEHQRLQAESAREKERLENVASGLAASHAEIRAERDALLAERDRFATAADERHREIQILAAESATLRSRLEAAEKELAQVNADEARARNAHAELAFSFAERVASEVRRAVEEEVGRLASEFRAAAENQRILKNEQKAVAFDEAAGWADRARSRGGA